MGKKSRELSKVVKNLGKGTKAESILSKILKSIDEFSDSIEDEINDSPFHDLFR